MVDPPSSQRPKRLAYSTVKLRRDADARGDVALFMMYDYSTIKGDTLKSSENKLKLDLDTDTDYMMCSTNNVPITATRKAPDGTSISGTLEADVTCTLMNSPDKVNLNVKVKFES